MKPARVILLFLAIPWLTAAEIESVPTQDEDICSLPCVVGECRAAFPRWFFNTATGACEEFIYGGCHGNKNNFETLEECQEACGVESSKEAHNEGNEGPGLKEMVGKVPHLPNEGSAPDMPREFFHLKEGQHLLPSLLMRRNEQARESELKQAEETYRKLNRLGKHPEDLRVFFPDQHRMRRDAPSEESQDNEERAKAEVHETLQELGFESDGKNQSQDSSPKTDVALSTPATAQPTTTSSPPTTGVPEGDQPLESSNSTKEPVVKSTTAPADKKTTEAEGSTTASPTTEAEGSEIESPTTEAKENTRNEEGSAIESPTTESEGSTSPSSTTTTLTSSTTASSTTEGGESTTASSTTAPLTSSTTASPTTMSTSSTTVTSSTIMETTTTMTPSTSSSVEASSSTPFIFPGEGEEEKVPDYSHEGETSNGPDSGGARESDIGQADFNAHRRNQVQEHTSSHFAAFFLSSIVLVFAIYVAYHNRQRIIAVIIEGRSENGRRRTGYRKMETNVEEAMPSMRSTTTAYVY